IVSSGGTHRVLSEAGIDVLSVEDVTESPEMLDGRVKTLHPRIHGGILADRSKPQHLKTLEENNITPIDLVVCNLYAFSEDPSVELIDIGGPSMVRSAAKNHDSVGVVVDPGDYDLVLEEIGASGQLSAATKRALARAAFAHTSAYDAAIVTWLDGERASKDAVADLLPPTLHFSLDRVQDLRYGENPHQVGARYRFDGQQGWWDTASFHGGKQLSYLNVFDTEAAWRLVNELGEQPAVAIIKHANPCGVAIDADITEAYVAAHSCDSMSAFGGIVALNRTVPLALAEELVSVFTEVVIAPGFEPEALERLQSKKNLRIVTALPPGPIEWQVRPVDAGFLVQQSDEFKSGRADWRVVTEAKPTEQQWADLELAWLVCARVTSNAIVLVKDGRAFGIGAGQQSRVDASRVAAYKADGRAAGGACASDAFFPFRDGIDAAAEAGAAVVVQPGGSIRDDEVIAAANSHAMAMVFTGERHFRH
ncbi:MAG: bifunctional phosphoribosylaminoimidazolecarboxamide formyltransferase/IMP cyclohydrolase, partial [Acidimicrobiales bacterium]